MPSVGDIVSLSYETLSADNTPVDPFVFRIRHDLTWRDVASSERDTTRNGMQQASDNCLLTD